MTRTFWLSFVDPDRPDGERFLGVAVVDVTDEDAARARLVLTARFPKALPDAEWIAAATSKAHREGCNPGGEVVAFDITPWHPQKQLAAMPRNRLLSRQDLHELEAASGI